MIHGKVIEGEVIFMCLMEEEIPEHFGHNAKILLHYFLYKQLVKYF